MLSPRAWNPSSNRLVFVFGAMILFFVLFDGIMTYLLPLVVLEHGLSKTQLGLILASAAVAGAFFDFAIYKIFKNAIYRRLFLAMFATGLLYIFLVWFAETIILYLIAMAVWGFYYDLKSFGTLDFVSRHSPKKEIAGNFGIVQAFQAIGALLAPLIAGFVILDYVDWEPFALALFFLILSAAFFFLLLREAKGKREFIPPREKPRKGGIMAEVASWRGVGLSLLPLFLLAIFSTIFDSFFVALGPLLAESLPLEPFDGFFMVAYFLPPFLIGGLVGGIVGKFGEKTSALGGLLIGGAILSTLAFIEIPLAAIAIVFFSSCFACLMQPVLQGIYARIIHETPRVKKEIQELSDFSGNFGYVLGPIAAGIIADSFGTAAAFSALGVAGVAFAILLFFILPKKPMIRTKADIRMKKPGITRANGR